MAEQEAVYQVDGKELKYKIKRVKYGDWQKVMQSSGSGNVELLGNITKGKIDTTRLMDDLMKLSVESLSGVDFHDLPMACGMDLQEKVLSFNGMNEQKPFRSE